MKFFGLVMNFSKIKTRFQEFDERKNSTVAISNGGEKIKLGHLKMAVGIFFCCELSLFSISLDFSF